MNVKQVPISEFKSHCSEELRAIEESDLTVEITRHGKVIAVAHAPIPEPAPGSLLGAAIGTATLSADYDPHGQAFAESDWDMNQ